MGPIAWLRARVGETPFRPDRSRLLEREKRGRLDRLDLWILIVLVVAAMGLRTYRLADPARMHFDEVYHARTAAEFLQFWRYGISHDIYEWTHPHLAKYAMAGGIVAFAGHDVDTGATSGSRSATAAVEPRREDPSGNGDRAGNRVWVATGSELSPTTSRPAGSSPAGPSRARARSRSTRPSTQLLRRAPTRATSWRSTRRPSTRTGGADPANPEVGPDPVATLDGARDRASPPTATARTRPRILGGRHRGGRRPRHRRDDRQRRGRGRRWRWRPSTT